MVQSRALHTVGYSGWEQRWSRVSMQSTRATSPAPRPCQAAPSISCSPAHRDCPKHCPKRGAGPAHGTGHGVPGTEDTAQGTPSLCVLLSALRRWAAEGAWAKRGGDRAATAQPCCARAGTGTAAAPGTAAASPLLPQPAQGAQCVSTAWLHSICLEIQLSPCYIPVRKSKNRWLESILLQFLRSLSRNGQIPSSPS